MPGGPKSTPSPRDWRAQSRSKPQSAGIKYARRIVLTLLVVALGGALVYLLLSSPAEIHFAVLPVSESDVLTLPPIPYSREGTESLGELELRPAVVNLQDIQTARGMATLAGKLREGLHKTDTLIVYLTGNCISDVGPDGSAAWLLCSDFAVPRETGGGASNPSGRYRLRDVLMQLKQCPAKTKLLILDSGYLNYDPRLGLFVNEFPRLLADDVRAVDDPDLWVLCSCGPLQTSHVCGPAKQSVFSYFVNQAFTGAASPGTRWVDLDQLLHYVREHVAGWVDRQTGGAESQTPWLLHRGGTDKPPQDYRLTPVLNRKPPPKLAPADAAAEGPPPPKQPSPEAVLNAELIDAWRLCDHMQQNAWSAIDYAPHLCREYQELLLSIDRRSRAGIAYDPKALTNEIVQELKDQGNWLDDSKGPVPAVGHPQTVGSRLVAALKRFNEHERLDPFFADSNPLRLAIHNKNVLLMRVPYYVRWNVVAARSSSGHGPLDQHLAKMLPLLAQLVTSLEQLQSAASPASTATTLPPQVADNLNALEGSFRTIEQAIDDKVKALEQHPDAVAIAALLDTPLPSAESRQRLLKAQAKVTDALPGDVSQRTLAPASPAAWATSLREQAEIEKQLVLLADPDHHFASLDDASTQDAGAGAGDDRFWKTYRQFGQELGSFYRGLPASIAKNLASGDSGAANRCDRYLRLVDARDAASVSEEVVDMVLPHARTTTSPNLAVKAESTPATELDGQYSIKLSIDKTDLPAAYGLITFDYARGDLTLTAADGKQTISSEEPFRAELRGGHTELVFKARAQVQSGKETPLAITVRCGDKTRKCQIALALPQPDVVALRAFRLAGNLDGSTDRRQEVESVLQFDRLAPQRLGPFPNRPTTYTFEMVNRSGPAKKLLVRTYVLPDWFWERNMNCRQACDMLARSATLLGETAVELAEQGKSQKFAFPAVKAPPKKPDEKPPEKPSEKPSEKPAAPEAKPKVDVSAGLAIVVCDAKNKEPEPKWIQIYSFVPLRPARYLDPTVHYDSDQGKLEIDVALAADRDIPPSSQKSPVRVSMALRDSAGRAVSVASGAGEGLRGQTKAILYPARPRDVLYAPVRSDDRNPLQVELSVDDYPRAFLYEAELNKLTSQRDLWRVRITSPAREPVGAFQPRETLPVKFHVDAPEDSFFARGIGAPAQRVGGADDMVLLEIFDEQHPETSRPQRFYSDRQVKVELEEADSPGEMKANTTVDDFTTEVDAHGLENVTARIRAQLLRDRQAKDEDSLRVILDGRPPEFELSLTSDRVFKGTDIRVAANVVRTLSDMNKFEYGFQGDAEKTFKDKTKSVEVRGRSASFALPTKELDPGEYTVLVRGDNKAGNADFRSAKVFVVEPSPPASEKPAGPATITVRGTVRWLDGSPASGAEVSIETPARSAKADAFGRFTFTDLPRGSYAVKAKGSTGGMRASGEGKADPGSGDTADVQISLSSLNR